MSQAPDKDCSWEFFFKHKVSLEITVCIRMALNSERPACLCLPNASCKVLSYPVAAAEISDSSPFLCKLTPREFLPRPNHVLKWRLSNHVIQILSPEFKGKLVTQQFSSAKLPSPALVTPSARWLSQFPAFPFQSWEEVCLPPGFILLDLAKGTTPNGRQ